MQIALLPQRSTAAFRMSCEELFERNRKVFFWTFTWPDAMPHWCYSRSWERFIDCLRRRYTSNEFQALRVWEKHPQGHGLHVHMLCNERLGVNMVRRIAVHFGLGRVLHARRARHADSLYMSKYLSKDLGVTGLRMWAKIGKWQHCPKNELKFDSLTCREWQTNFRCARAGGANGGEAFRYATLMDRMTTAQQAAHWAELSRDNSRPVFRKDAPTDVTTVWNDGDVTKQFHGETYKPAQRRKR